MVEQPPTISGTDMSKKTVPLIKKPMPLNRLGMLLKKAGYQNKMVGASRTRGWIVRERGMEEVNANRNIEGRS